MIVIINDLGGLDATQAQRVLCLKYIDATEQSATAIVRY